MATGATGTPTTNYSIPKYATSADAPNGTGFNSAMDAIDLALKGVADAAFQPSGTPTEGQTILWTSGAAAWGDAASGGGSPPVRFEAPDQTGFAFPNVVALTAWYAPVWEFTKDQDASIYGKVLVPSGMTSGNLRVALAANSTSGLISRMQALYNPVADTESLNPASFTSVTAQDVTMPTTAYKRKDITFALTGLAALDIITVRLFHNGAHANDTLAENTLVLGAWLEAA